MYTTPLIELYAIQLYQLYRQGKITGADALIVLADYIEELNLIGTHVVRE